LVAEVPRIRDEGDLCIVKAIIQLFRFFIHSVAERLYN